MALEVEVKILEIDPEKLRTNLLKLGAKEIFAGNIHVVYFVLPRERKMKTRNLMRIREYEGQKIQMTYKQTIPNKKAKVQKEYEFEINDFDSAEKMVLALGFEILEKYTKYMATYEIDDVRVDIEKYEKIPHNAEIEGPSRQVIDEYVKKLDLNSKNVRPWSEKELFAHYNIYKP